jgi:16S rRNA C967 or C1407 C5-methylase (RsmB/RsmF family)
MRFEAVAVAVAKPMRLLFCPSVMSGGVRHHRRRRRRLNARLDRSEEGASRQLDSLVTDATSSSEQRVCDGRRQRSCSREKPDARAQPLCSPAMESFYSRQQSLFRDSADREALFRCLTLPLPTCFRVVAANPFGAFVQQQLTQQLSPAVTAPVLKAAHEQVQSRVGAEIPVEPWLLEPPTPLPWYPQRLAWQVSLPRALLRRHPALQSLHEFLVAEHEFGSIHRQEAVSMIPPLLLDVAPGQRILDLCAAPGSKTAQILDLVASRSLNQKDAALSTLLVANDVDRKRCWMLVHQLQRYALPAVLVTNFDASSWPLRDLAFRFDRVLCDVPCSGDGTLRKSPDLWQRWSLRQARSLHRLQIRIAIRGVEALVANGSGRMVYSTCSLNPLENEAVVAAILRHFGPEKLELIDTSVCLPALQSRPGLDHWDSCLDQALSAADKSLEPPAPMERSWMHLERCMRIMPQDQNTGGFFVALFQRKAASDGAIGHQNGVCADELANKRPDTGSEQAAQDVPKMATDTRHRSEASAFTTALEVSAGTSTRTRDIAIADSLQHECALQNQALFPHERSVAARMQTEETLSLARSMPSILALTETTSAETPTEVLTDQCGGFEGTGTSLSPQREASSTSVTHTNEVSGGKGMPANSPFMTEMDRIEQHDLREASASSQARQKTTTAGTQSGPSERPSGQILEPKSWQMPAMCDPSDRMKTQKPDTIDNADDSCDFDDEPHQQSTSEHAAGDTAVSGETAFVEPSRSPSTLDAFAGRLRGPRDPPMIPLKETPFGAFVMERIATSYGIRMETLEAHLFCRVYLDQCSALPSKRLRLHWLTDSVRAMLGYHRHRPERLLLAGIRAFEAMEIHQAAAADSQEQPKLWFRIAQEAIPTLLPHIAPERLVQLTAVDLTMLLRETCLSTSQLGFRFSSIANARTRVHLENLSLGPVILSGTLTPVGADMQDVTIPLYLSAWKTSAHSVSLFVPAEEARAIRRALGHPSEGKAS